MHFVDEKEAEDVLNCLQEEVVFMTKSSCGSNTISIATQSKLLVDNTLGPGFASLTYWIKESSWLFQASIVDVEPMPGAFGM